MTKLLIFGCNGFIGSACSAYFNNNNIIYRADVHGFSDANYFQVIDKKSFNNIISNVKPDILINASGSANVGFSFEFPEKDYELNVVNVEMMLQAIKEHAPLCKFINFSSAAVYGNPKLLPVKENGDTVPLSPYGKHKLQSEIILKHFHDKFGLKTSSLRVFSAYGPGLYKQLFWDIYQKALVSTGEIELFGTGNESRDFIYIDDLVHAVDLIINNAQFKGEAINIASGVETAIRDAALYFIKLFNRNLYLKFNNKTKTGDPVNWKADITKLNELGYVSKTSLSVGLSNTYHNYLRVNAK